MSFENIFFRFRSSNSKRHSWRHDTNGRYDPRGNDTIREDDSYRYYRYDAKYDAVCSYANGTKSNGNGYTKSSSIVANDTGTVTGIQARQTCGIFEYLSL